MKREMTYNLIRTSRKTLKDYLQKLESDELQSIYTSTFKYGLKSPDLLRKIQAELQRRNLSAQPLLF